MIGSTKPAGSKPGRPVPVPTGMRRVNWVRIVVTDGGTHCSVAGIGHRLPMIRPVSLETALALSAAGVPTVVRSDTPAPPASGPGVRRAS